MKTWDNTQLKLELAVLRRKCEDTEHKLRDTSRELARWIRRAKEAEARLNSLGLKTEQTDAIN